MVTQLSYTKEPSSGDLFVHVKDRSCRIGAGKNRGSATFKHARRQQKQRAKNALLRAILRKRGTFYLAAVVNGFATNSTLLALAPKARKGRSQCEVLHLNVI